MALSERNRTGISSRFSRTIFHTISHQRSHIKSSTKNLPYKLSHQNSPTSLTDVLTLLWRYLVDCPTSSYLLKARKETRATNSQVVFMSLLSPWPGSRCACFAGQSSKVSSSIVKRENKYSDLGCSISAANMILNKDRFPVFLA